MSMIDIFNSTISNALNKGGDPLYHAWIGDSEFTPEAVITTSSDFNCGAVCNELEMVRTVSNYYMRCLAVDFAEDTELDDLITRLIDLPRRGNIETDYGYRRRYKFMVYQKANYRRITRWAILDAVSHFIDDMDAVQLVEPFNTDNLYFQVRFEGAGTVTTDDVIFMDNAEQAYIDHNFVGGVGIGEVVTYVGELINRIKAVGVDFDVMFIEQFRCTKDSDCIVGSVQKYLDSDAIIMQIRSTTLQSNAEIVV